MKVSHIDVCVMIEDIKIEPPRAVQLCASDGWFSVTVAQGTYGSVMLR